VSLFNPLAYDTRPMAPEPGPPRKDRGERLFSTGTEAADWERFWCGQCARDHEMHAERGPGCLIYADEMFDNAERFEIVDGSAERGYTIPSQVVCNAFVQCNECEDDPALRATRDDPTRLITWRQFAAEARASCGPFSAVIPFEEQAS